MIIATPDQIWEMQFLLDALLRKKHSKTTQASLEKLKSIIDQISRKPKLVKANKDHEMIPNIRVNIDAVPNETSDLFRKYLTDI